MLHWFYTSKGVYYQVCREKGTPATPSVMTCSPRIERLSENNRNIQRHELLGEDALVYKRLGHCSSDCTQGKK